MLFKKRTFNERKDRDVFCNGKMFDRKMFLIINNDKYIALNFSSIYNICNQLKSSYFKLFEYVLYKFEIAVF